MLIPKPNFGSLTDETRCPDNPALPSASADNTQKALYVSRRFEAGDMCRNAFRALREKAIDTAGGNSAK